MYGRLNASVDIKIVKNAMTFFYYKFVFIAIVFSLAFTNMPI